MVLYNRQRRHAGAQFLRPKKLLPEAILLIAIAVGLYTNILRLAAPLLAQSGHVYAVTQPASHVAAPASATNAGASTTDAEPQITPSNVRAVATPAIETPRACTGNTYALPQPVSLSGAAFGLTKQIDTPTYYTVYGSSVSALRNAVVDCPLRKAAGAFHATTAYQLNWAYTPVAEKGVCSIKDIKVGLHVNQLMPAFSPGSTVSSEVRSAWDAYSRALQTHENGHTAINTDYAARLTTALQNVGQMDCSTLTRQVQTIIDTHVTMLNTANELYDAQTNHGATQGAVL